MTRGLPHLHDGLVTLRFPEPADVDAIYAACQDAEIQRFTMVPSPYTREHAVAWVRDSPRRWAEESTAHFLVVDGVTDALFGSCGVNRLDGAGGNVGEVGYWLARGARGRGFITRAVRLVSRWALTDLGLSRLDLHTDVANHASQRVAARAGFHRMGEVPAPERFSDRSETMVLFSLTGEAQGRSNHADREYGPGAESPGRTHGAR